MIFFPLNSSMIHDLPTSCPAPLQRGGGADQRWLDQTWGTHRGRIVSKSLSSAGPDVSALRLAMVHAQSVHARGFKVQRATEISRQKAVSCLLTMARARGSVPDSPPPDPLASVPGSLPYACAIFTYDLWTPRNEKSGREPGLFYHVSDVEGREKVERT